MPEQAICTPKSPSCGAICLPESFYAGPPDSVAPKLLGKLLISPANGAEPELVGRIVEVEAYFGDSDPAAHAFSGKTARNAVLFGPPGRAYIYFIYGMYFCLNVSCEPEGRAGGVLFRALEPLAGLSAMARRRWPKAVENGPGTRKLSPGTENFARELTSGPGRLCQAFGITRARDNGTDFTSPHSGLQIRDDGFLTGQIQVTPRIGLRKAEERLARYVIKGSKFISRH